MKKLLVLITSLFLFGCGVKVADDMKTEQTVGLSNNRIIVERINSVRDNLAYGGRRGIYLITDTKTGIEYIGISGIGISETGSHSSGKYYTSDER